MRSTSAMLLLLLSCAAPAPLTPPGPPFRNIAAEVGVAGIPAGRIVFADFTNDGHDDIVLDRKKFLAWDNGKYVAFDPGFTQVPDVLIFGDVDNDGDVDLFWGEYVEPAKDTGERSAIWLNDGKGRFTVVANSGVDKSPATTCAATFFDYDRDGKLDLYVGNWYRTYGNGFVCHPSLLYRGRGDGTFEDVTGPAGIHMMENEGQPGSARPVYGVTHADWNNDGWPDLLVCAYGRQWNVLWRNNGDGTFSDAGEMTGFDGDADRSGVYPHEARQHPQLKDITDEKPFRSNGNTFDAAVGDYNNDGLLDVFLAEITHWWAGSSSDRSSLLTNQGPSKGFAFRRDADAMPRKHEGAKWNQGDLYATWLDYDNDGRLDLLLSSGDYPDRQELRLFRQSEGGTFADVTTFDWEGGAQISVTDIDSDGDLDILVGRSFHRLPAERTKGRIPEAGLFRNDIGNRKSWIEFRLEGTTANRSAIGARVMVRTGSRTQMREIRGGEGHAGHQNPPLVHFGLGDSTSVDEVVVTWPDAAQTRQTIKDVTAKRVYQLRQGEALR